MLCSSSQHADLYLDVFQAILRYWDIPVSVLPLPELTESDKKLEVIKEGANFPAVSLPPLKGSTSIIDIVNTEKHGSTVNESDAGNVTASLRTSCNITQDDLPGSQSNGNTKQQQCMLNMKLPEENESTSSVSQQADPADSSRQSFANMSSAVGVTAYTSNGNASYIGHANVKRYLVTSSSLGKEANHLTSGKGDNTSLGDFVYMGYLYKPQTYLNHYMHGDFAASAAAKLAGLSSEETRFSETHALDNHRKFTSINNLQSKAFSLTASRFFWPSSEKKLVEVPRERCGWCLSCKAAVSSKRGCMLNHAALSATKGAMRILANLRPMKSGEGSVASIATYILYMEESLCGLVVGPFLNANYRKQWHKRVEQASTVSEVKALLLEVSS